MLGPFNSIVSGTCLGYLRHIQNQAFEWPVDEMNQGLQIQIGSTVLCLC